MGLFMDYDTIAVINNDDPAIRAFGKKWLPLAVSFFHNVFKQTHEVQIPQDLFIEKLDEYIEYVNSMLEDDDQHRNDARHYVNRWSTEDELIRIRMSNDQYVVQLSPYAERLIGWFEDMQQRGMIGTESRLLNIVSQLEDVVTRSTEDIGERLNQLYARRDEIDAEIQRIEETSEIDGLTDLQIRERLDHISGMASQLLRDFSLVEERFRDLARTIQQAQLDPAAKRGQILGTALDVDEQLQESDEGQSFRAFYELLTHPEQRNIFESLIGAVYDQPRLNRFASNNATLRRLTTHLLDAGERVNQSNQRLAEHLRRVVDTRNVLESRRVQTLSQEIKHLVSRLGDDDLVPMLSPRRRFFAMEGDPIVELPLERPLFEPPEHLVASDRPQQAGNAIDVSTLLSLYETFYIDDTALRDNIRRMLMSKVEVSLSELIKSYPITQGISEVVSYLLIAIDTPQHEVDRTNPEVITVKMVNGNERNLTIPRLVFRRESTLMETNHA